MVLRQGIKFKMCLVAAKFYVTDYNNRYEINIQFEIKDQTENFAVTRRQLKEANDWLLRQGVVSLYGDDCETIYVFKELNPETELATDLRNMDSRKYGPETRTLTQ